MKKTVSYYLAIGFILNFIWEISQAGLYKSHFQGITDFLLVHLKATLGDIVMLLVMYLIVGLIYTDWKWLGKSSISSYILVAFIGFMFAVAVEKYALLTGRWAYNELMPIIPLINIGIIPVLQLIIIAPLSAFLAVRLASSSNKKGKEM